MKYLIVLVDLIEKNRVNSNKYRNIKKNRNKIIKIFIKSWNLLKSKFANLCKFKNLVKV